MPKNFPTFLVFLALLFLLGCRNITGKAVLEFKETNKGYNAHFCNKENCERIVNYYINNSQSSIHCAFYKINLKSIIKNLEKKSRVMDVKIVTDESNEILKNVKSFIFKKAKSYGLMHNKFCIIDKELILTGSFNPTEQYLNDNNIFVIYSKLLAENYEDEFKELWNGVYGKGERTKHQIIVYNNISIENYFCPEDCQSKFRIIDLIRNAKKSIHLASFTFTNEEIADELIRAEARGVNVAIIIEKRQRNVMGSQYERLKGFGLNVKLDNNKGSMHHKFIIIDSKVVITGSPNFTLSGFNKNDENLLIIYNEDIALKYIKEFDRLFSQ